MNDSAFGAPDIGTALTEQEMTELVGGDGYFARALGYGIGFMAALIVNTALNPEMQQYCFGA